MNLSLRKGSAGGRRSWTTVLALGSNLFGESPAAEYLFWESQVNVTAKLFRAAI
jgi:hypothetical protein